MLQRRSGLQKTKTDDGAQKDGCDGNENNGDSDDEDDFENDLKVVDLVVHLPLSRSWRRLE